MKILNERKINLATGVKSKETFLVIWNFQLEPDAVYLDDADINNKANIIQRNQAK